MYSYVLIEFQNQTINKKAPHEYAGLNILKVLVILQFLFSRLLQPQAHQLKPLLLQ
jgi:hypothetical protein